MNAVLADPLDDYVPSEDSLSPPLSEKCSRCEGKKTIFSREHGKHIRCPACTGTGKAGAERLVAELNGMERRRINEARRKIDAAVAQALREYKAPEMLDDPKDLAVDRIMQRWAVGHGNLPPEDADLGALVARPPPLDPETQMLIDDLIRSAPPLVRLFAFDWYRSEASCTQIAERCRVSCRTIYRRWHFVLEWLEMMFRASGHSTLLRLLVIGRS